MKSLLIVKQIDKANHFILGYLIYFVMFLLFNWYYALLGVILLAFGKELIDSYMRKLPIDKSDLFYTIAGAIPSLVISLI